MTQRASPFREADFPTKMIFICKSMEFYNCAQGRFLQHWHAYIYIQCKKGNVKSHIDVLMYSDEAERVPSPDPRQLGPHQVQLTGGSGESGTG